MKLLDKLHMEQIVARSFLHALIVGFDSFDKMSDTLDTRHALLILNHALDCAHKYADEAGDFEQMESPSKALIMSHHYINKIGEVIHELIDRDPKPDNVPTFTSDKWCSEIRDGFFHRYIIANMLMDSGEKIYDSDGDECTPQYAAYDALSSELKNQYLLDNIGFTEFTAKREYLMDIYNICFLKAKP